MMIAQQLKSKTNRYAGAIIVFTAIQDNMPLLQEYMGQYYNLAMYAIAVGIILFRQITKTPIAEK